MIHTMTVLAIHLSENRGLTWTARPRREYRRAP